MLNVRVIPCLDVRDGRVVKGVKFQRLADQGDPAELARAYEHEGADEIVILDVSATSAGRRVRNEVIGRVREEIG
ncbi:MAG: HisA/HisF-related TIM barrel protein, partial [Gemmatimonadota bacterium]|nr:HisA/HisF-related TIM barrel protein [Gemmatimonadota bacterium]